MARLPVAQAPYMQWSPRDFSNGSETFASDTYNMIQQARRNELAMENTRAKMLIDQAQEKRDQFGHEQDIRNAQMAAIDKATQLAETNPELAIRYLRSQGLNVQGMDPLTEGAEREIAQAEKAQQWQGGGPLPDQVEKSGVGLTGEPVQQPQQPVRQGSKAYGYQMAGEEYPVAPQPQQAPEASAPMPVPQEPVPQAGPQPQQPVQQQQAPQPQAARPFGGRIQYQAFGDDGVIDPRLNDSLRQAAAARTGERLATGYEDGDRDMVQGFVQGGLTPYQAVQETGRDIGRQTNALLRREAEAGRNARQQTMLTWREQDREDKQRFTGYQNQLNRESRERIANSMRMFSNAFRMANFDMATKKLAGQETEKVLNRWGMKGSLEDMAVLSQLHTQLMSDNSALHKQAAFKWARLANGAGVLTTDDVKRSYTGIGGVTVNLAEWWQNIVDGTVPEDKLDILSEAVATLARSKAQRMKAVQDSLAFALKSYEPTAKFAKAYEGTYFPGARDENYQVPGPDMSGLSGPGGAGVEIRGPSAAPDQRGATMDFVESRNPLMRSRAQERGRGAMRGSRAKSGGRDRVDSLLEEF